MAKIFRGGETQFRIRIGALGATEPGRVLFEGEFFDAAPPAGGGAATWFTPAAPLSVTPASPEQYYQATLAWSYRHGPGDIDHPRPTNKMMDTPRGSFIDIDDGGGGTDALGRRLTIQILDLGWAGAYLMQLVSNYLLPDQTHNFVLLFDEAGGLSGGNTVQLWCNGTLVASTSYAYASMDISSLTLLGTGTTELPGETQGFWFSGDTAIAPATVFADLFDGANGMLDINADPTVGGVTPDNYYIEPGSGPSGITGTASGTAGVTGSSAASARTTASVSGAADVTGASAGTLRAFATITGTANVTGTATATAGATSITGTASGTADVTWAASGTLRAAVTVSGTAGTTGAATVSARTTAAATGSADVTGTATVAARTTASVTGGASVVGASTGTLRATATASGSVDVSGAATGNVEAGSNIATASGTADVTGTATATVAALTATAAGEADVTGQATATAYATRNILVWGTWPDHSYLGHWPDNTAIGTWRAPKAAGAHREIIVQGRWA